MLCSETNPYGMKTFSNNSHKSCFDCSDDAWDLQDAQVVCKMLGFDPRFARNTSKSLFGKVADFFIMDNVDCNGSEMTLEDCTYLANDDCGVEEGAGVICYGELSENLTPKVLEVKFVSRKRARDMF